MFGERRGDFSRVRPDEAARYDGIHMQQGRVHLDSDWNAQSDMLDRRLRSMVTDLVGTSGVPARSPGFGIFAFESFLIQGRARLDVQYSKELYGGAHDVDLGEERHRHRPTLELSLQCAKPCWLHRPPGLSARGVVPLQCLQEPPETGGIALQSGQAVLLALGAGPGDPLLLNRRPVAMPNPADPPPKSSETVNGFEIFFGDGVSLELFEIRLWSFDLRSFGLSDTTEPERLLAPEAMSRLVQTEATGGTPRLLGFWRGQADPKHGPSTSHARPFRGYGLGQATAEIQGRACRARLQLGITPGRFYVQGLTRELPHSVPFSAQPDFPGASPPAPRAAKPSSFLVYLDLWRRSVYTLGESPHSEVALRGLDTGVLERTLAQVRCLALPPKPEDADLAWASWTADAPARQAALCIRPLHGIPEQLNTLYRIEIHFGGFCAGSSWTQTRGWRIRLAERGPKGNPPQSGMWVQLRGYLAHRWPWSLGQPLELHFGQGRSCQGKVLERIGQGWLRVEGGLSAHDSRDAYVRPVAAFKWAPDNACAVRPVLKIEPLDDAARFQLGPWLGARGVMGEGSVVELVDDLTTLRGTPSPLWTVAKTQEHDPGMDGHWTLRSSHSSVPADLHRHTPYVRSWGQTRRQDPDVLDSGVLPVQKQKSVSIDGRFAVQFAEQGEYRHGDFWWVEVRHNRVQWPPKGSEGRYHPPTGVEHRYARLARLDVSSDGGFRVLDLRQTFSPSLDGHVGKVGPQTMEGPLTVHGDIQISEGADGPSGRVVADLEGRLLSEGIVEERHLVRNAVTPEHLAPEVGWIPPGFSILGPANEAPPGYEATGADLHLYHDDNPWHDRFRLPIPASIPLRMAAIGGLLVVFSAAGDVWHVDPVGGHAEPGEDWPQPRRHAALAVLDDRVHLLGGLDTAGRPTETHWVYEPNAGSWSLDEPLSSPRAALAAVAWEGSLHVVGGFERTWWGLRPVTDHEVFEPSDVSNLWQPRRSLPLALAHVGFASTHFGLHVVGGWHRGLFKCRSVKNHWLYDHVTDLWTPRAPLPSPLQRHGLVGTSRDLFALGGRQSGVATASHHRYDPRVDGWVSQTHLHVPLSSPGAAAVGEWLFAVGAPALDGGVLLESRRVLTHQHVYRKQTPPPPLRRSSHGQATHPTTHRRTPLWEQSGLPPFDSQSP